MSDELKDFRYYADKAEALLIEVVEPDVNMNGAKWRTDVAAVYVELAKAAPKAEPIATARCLEWLSQGNRDLPRGFIDYQCVLFAGHSTEHESSTGQYWIAEAGTSA